MSVTVKLININRFREGKVSKGFNSLFIPHLMENWPWVYETVGVVDSKWNENCLRFALFG